MFRRRRRVREIPFSFDSFLDIVANVVGVIIRLILVVWVGARSYSSIQVAVTTPAPVKEVAGEEKLPPDPVEQDMARHRLELARAKEKLLDQLRRLEETDKIHSRTESELATLKARDASLEIEARNLDALKGDKENEAKTVALTSAELTQRSQKLAEEIRKLEELPPPKKTLRYQTPISRPVQSEELLFECNQGRITFVDIAGLLKPVQETMQEKGQLLKDRWQIEDVTETVGAFRLRYSIERERELLDAVAGDAPPASNGSFRYGISAWQIEPIAMTRGETVAEALNENSEFRQIVDGIDPRQTTVTIWLYPDSFEVFRKLRDYLYQREIIVAGRPLPVGMPIASSRRGSVSRGQ
jgi:hypothetical protein